MSGRRTFTKSNSSSYIPLQTWTELDLSASEDELYTASISEDSESGFDDTNSSPLMISESQFLQHLASVPIHDERTELINKRLQSLNPKMLQSPIDLSPLLPFTTPAWKIALYRLPAIFITIALELAVSFVVQAHDKLLAAYVILTVFQPILSSVTGNVGIQASSATLRQLPNTASKSSLLRFLITRLRTELSATLWLTLPACLSIFIITAVWDSDNPITIAFITSLSMFASILLAAISGCAAPVVFSIAGFNPVLCSGPVETSLQDVVAFGVYLTAASLVLPVK